MRVYQLVAVGELELNGQRHVAYSETAYGHRVVYSTEEKAEKAIPGFKKQLTTAKEKNDSMVMKDNPLRVFVEPLEVI